MDHFGYERFDLRMVASKDCGVVLLILMIVAGFVYQRLSMIVHNLWLYVNWSSMAWLPHGTLSFNDCVI
jgi:hypothetical protein